MSTRTIRLITVRATLLAASFAVMVLFQNCSDAKFSSGSDVNGSNTGQGVGNGLNGDDYRDNLNQPNTNTDSCYTYLHQTAADVRLLFSVDISGSNSGFNGSDPNRAVRGGSIQAFYTDYSSKSNFSWAFNTFKGTSSEALITDGLGGPRFGSSANMSTAINTFGFTTDSGTTPYIAATNLIRTAIQNDTSYNATTKWIVVFLSDGLPNPTVPDADLISAVQGIVGLRPGQVTFNTIYYGVTDPVASGRLSLMAQIGGGHFLDTNANPTGKSFLISNVINVPGTTCKP